MDLNQKLQSYRNNPLYEIHMIGSLKPITITEEEREKIISALSEGRSHIVVREYILMIASIKYITPLNPKKDISKKCKMCNGKTWIVGIFDEEKQVFLQDPCPSCQK